MITHSPGTTTSTVTVGGGSNAVVLNATNLGVTSTGHLQAKGAAPTASTCGTGPTVAVTSTDTAGAVTVGTGGTACTLTFDNAFGTAPFCAASKSTTGSFSTTTSTTAITFGGLAAGDVLRWVCIEGL